VRDEYMPVLELEHVFSVPRFDFEHVSGIMVVVEADEYDRSFLKLFPDIAVITSMDPDHLDIYGTPEEVVNAFIQFSQKLKPGGCLVNKYDLERGEELKAAHHYTYSFEDARADVYAANRKVLNGS